MFHFNICFTAFWATFILKKGGGAGRVEAAWVFAKGKNPTCLASLDIPLYIE
jgi:hypothetical protein